MKKKMNPKQMREARQQEQAAKWKQQQAEREQELLRQQEAQAEKEFRRKLPPKTQRKSLAKAMGLKSSIVISDSVVMTSFGKGNNAILEKRIEASAAADLNADHPAFSVREITNEKYTLANGRIKGCIATADNPMHTAASKEVSVPQDMLGLKPVLEQRFYGAEFPDDNVHIQVIYNILDIEKILAVYATNAVYAINNLFRAEGRESEDFVGYLTTQNLYHDIDNATEPTDNRANSKAKNSYNTKVNLTALLHNKRTGYFGQAFYESAKYRRSEKDIYDILALIGQLRQWAVHGNKSNDPAWLYKLDNLPDEFKDVLDKVYAETVQRVNHDFVKTNAVNLQILEEVFTKDSFAEIVKEYYEFLVTKKHKNIGFSIKRLREIMIDDSSLKDNKYDSVRHKLYHLLDFILYHGYCQEDAGIAEDLVNALRASLSESDKTMIYMKEAERLNKKHGTSLFRMLSKSVEGKNIKELHNNDLEDVDLRGVEISTGDDVSYFTKLMYLLTLFLDGKEINDLLTTLINKFDNIRVFNQTLGELELSATFKDDYSFFQNCGTIFKELTILNSFARMSSIDPSARKDMYRDAVEILGIPNDMSDEAFEEMLDNMMCYDKDGNPIVNAEGKKKSGMRNFIASNVISSGRFKYLVRYGNSKKIRTLANCGNVVRFVLSTIPDEQIMRYYDACHDPDEPYEDAITLKREHLAGIIRNMNFGQFHEMERLQEYHVDRPTNGSTVEGEQKQRYQAVIRLYLTVMYLLLKNMVYINSRYVMGFHALERDAVLYKSPLKDDLRKLLVSIMDIRLPNGTIMTECDGSKAANIKGNRYLRSKKWYSIAFTNYQNSDKKVINEFRNTVAHLNAIRNIDENMLGIGDLDPETGYFEMFHYLIQMHLKTTFERNETDNASGTSYKKPVPSNPKTAEYFEKLVTYHTYCRDFVKAYCVPMAYNLPRFKNLTIDGQFDKNRSKTTNQK